MENEDLKEKENEEEIEEVEEVEVENEDEDVENEDENETSDDEDEDDDTSFLKSLLGEDDEEDRSQKNKDAEEARKRREAEAKAKKEAEEKAKKEAEEKAKREAEEKAKNDNQDNQEQRKLEAQNQVKDLLVKYPNLDLAGLDKNEAFKKFSKNKWVVGGDTITKIYEDFVDLESSITKETKEKVQQRHLKSTPSIKGKSKQTPNTTEYFSERELENIAERLPFMSSRDYDKISKKYNDSIKYYNKK